MANVLVEETSLTNIANAIRTKEGEQAGGSMTPAQMPTRIANLPSGGIPAVESVTINNKSELATLSMPADGSYRDYLLNVTVLPATAPQITQVIVSDTSIATVKDNGDGTHSLRVISGGTTTVTVKDYSGTITDSFTMQVNVALQSFSIAQGAYAEVPAGGTRQLSCDFVPRAATNKTIVWSSDSQSVTINSETGLVTAIGSGNATISAYNAELDQTKTIQVSAVAYVDNPDWAAIKTAVAAGQQPYGIGSELSISWKQYTSATGYNSRTVTWVVMHYGTVEDENGNQKPAMFLQTKQTVSPNSGISFETETRVAATEATAQAGVYYYGYNGSTYTTLNLETGDTIPYELYTNVYKSGIDFSKNVSQISLNGLGWWAGSWLRQWLNSESTAQGFGWVNHHISDTNGGSGLYGGFLRGFDTDFINALTPIKVNTARDNVICSQEIETTIDRIFVPSKEQVYAVRETGVAAGAEGEAWDYYISQSGVSAPTDSNLTCRVKQEVGTSTARNWWLRSANRSNANNEWNMNNSGTASNSNANNSGSNYRVAPACVIC